MATTLFPGMPDADTVRQRLLKHVANQSADIKPTKHQWSTEIYRSPTYWKKDEALFENTPVCLGPVQGIGGALHSLSVREVFGRSWIIWRTGENSFAAFANRCQHRGMPLVAEKNCQAKTLVCPYHAWSYGTDGVCVGIPERAKAFPHLDTKKIRLEERKVEVHGGALFLLPDGKKPVKNFFNPLGEHFSTWNLESLQLRATNHYQVAANWKIIVEAFLEAYHIPYVHRTTLAPPTLTTTWLQDTYGPHSRGIYPIKRLQEDLKLQEAPLRRYSSVVYHLFPNTLVSFQPFHTLVSQFWPKAPDRTDVDIYFLVSAEDAEKNASLVEKDIDLLKSGIAQDYANAEALHSTISASHPQKLNAGNFESLIQHFHKGLAYKGN